MPDPSCRESHGAQQVPLRLHRKPRGPVRTYCLYFRHGSRWPGGTVSRESGGQVRERTSHRRDSRDPWKTPRPMGPEGGWHSSPHSQRRELPPDELFNGQGNRRVLLYCTHFAQ